MTDLPRTTQALTLHPRNARLYAAALLAQAINAGLITTGLIILLLMTFDFPLALRGGAEGYIVIAKLGGLVLTALLVSALPLITLRRARRGVYSLPLTAATLVTGLLTFPLGTLCAVAAASTLRRA